MTCRERSASTCFPAPGCSRLKPPLPLASFLKIERRALLARHPVHLSEGEHRATGRRVVASPPVVDVAELREQGVEDLDRVAVVALAEVGVADVERAAAVLGAAERRVALVDRLGAVAAWLDEPPGEGELAEARALLAPAVDRQRLALDHPLAAPQQHGHLLVLDEGPQRAGEDHLLADRELAVPEALQAQLDLGGTPARLAAEPGQAGPLTPRGIGELPAALAGCRGGVGHRDGVLPGCRRGPSDDACERAEDSERDAKSRRHRADHMPRTADRRRGALTAM